MNYEKEFAESFFKVLHAGFSHPRKQLAGNFSKGLGIDREAAVELLAKNNIYPQQRAETVNLEQWKSLAYSFASKNNL
jgi:16S rRNA (adenine1518-N6/adenine1519-N6)-dimethyltransferase